MNFKNDSHDEQKLIKLVRDLYLKLENDHGRQPYSWAELNPELMERIKEFVNV